MYIFYGVEIPKHWNQWPSAFGDSPRVIEWRRWEIEVPNIGGGPVLRDGKAVIVQDFELTLFRYPHDQEDVCGQENLGVLGFLVCEIEPYTNPRAAFDRYKEWEQKFAVATNFDVTIRDACQILEFNAIQPTLLTCEANCSCC